MEETMELRKKAEAEFHDRIRQEAPFQRYTLAAEDEVQKDPLWSNFKFYSVERASRAHFDRWLSTRCPGRRLLDFGCGNGEDSILAAQNGATVVGIDISEVSITHCRQRALAACLSESIEFHVMDAEALKFEDNSFDLIMEYGVLHHLDFSAAMREIARVLRPTGAVICTEALGHNPVIRAYRRRTPHLRTAWEVEHILRKETIQLARKWFAQVNLRFYHLATLASVPFRRTPLFGSVLTSLEAVDAVLLRMPFLRWQAWQVVIELSQPRKS